MQLIKYLFVCVVCLFWPLFVGFADIKQNSKIQSYMNALGYNVGQIDGFIGKNSRKQLISVLKEHGLEFDGVVDNNELQIHRKIATNKNIDLTERRLGISYKNLLQIMDEKTAKLFVPNSRNIKKVDGFEIVDFKGRKAARMSISMNDKGHPDDWGRFGRAGTAQRLQIQEKPRVYEMRDGEVYWYKFSIFIPNYVGSDYHTISPFDLKDRKNGRQRDPAIIFTITNNKMTFQLKTTGEECRKIKNMQGEVSDFCERPGLIAIMEGNNYFKNRWLDFVFQMDMRKGKEITRLWVNEKLIGVIKGDLSPQGKFLGFKFGPYRNSITKPPQDEVIYYADIMRRASCEDLEIPNCEQFSNAPLNKGIYGAKELLRCFREPERGMPCPVICVDRACESL